MLPHEFARDPARRLAGRRLRRHRAARDEVLFGPRRPRHVARGGPARARPARRDHEIPALRSESWDYHYQDLWGYRAVMSIVFGPDGRSQEKIVHRLSDGGGESRPVILYSISGGYWYNL
jgi:hypothetical protein